MPRIQKSISLTQKTRENVNEVNKLFDESVSTQRIPSDIYMYSSIKLGYMYYVIGTLAIVDSINFMTFLQAFSAELAKRTLL